MGKSLSAILISLACAVSACVVSGCAPTQLANTPTIESRTLARSSAQLTLEQGFDAYKDGDYDQALSLLEPFAQNDHPKALRITGLLMVERSGDPAAQSIGLERLYNAALNGDRIALLILNERMASGKTPTPSVDRLIEIETALAKGGDPVMAWRLAERYRLCEDVPPSLDKSIYWLVLVARTDHDAYPNKREAQNNLCNIHADPNSAQANLRKARHWCTIAARNGHAGAAITLSRLGRPVSARHSSSGL